MSQRKTVTCPNPDVLAQAVAVRVLTTIRNLLAEPGRSRVDIALTGGTDGNRVLRAIGTDPLADDLDASRVHIWWGDERFVPEDSQAGAAVPEHPGGARADAGGEHPRDVR